MIDERHRMRHWTATKRLVFVLLSVFLTIIVVVPAFYNRLDNVSFLGFPLGYFLVAIGGLCLMAGLLFWMAIRQDNIDRKYGASENI